MDDPSVLTFLTDFADQAVILPLFVAVTLVLWAQRRWRVAAMWLLAVPGVLGTLLALKAVCVTCGWLIPLLAPDQLALHSPSGHAGSAAVTYGGIAVLTVSRGRPRAVALAGAVGAAALIGVTRLELGVHSLSEVVVASCLGVAGAVAFAWWAGDRVSEQSGLPVIAAALLVILLFHGLHLPAEQTIQSTSAEILRRLVPACRED